jgi:hypothetical protein
VYLGSRHHSDQSPAPGSGSSGGDGRGVQGAEYLCSDFPSCHVTNDKPTPGDGSASSKLQ